MFKNWFKKRIAYEKRVRVPTKTIFFAHDFNSLLKSKNDIIKIEKMLKGGISLHQIRNHVIQYRVINGERICDYCGMKVSKLNKKSFKNEYETKVDWVER